MAKKPKTFKPYTMIGEPIRGFQCWVIQYRTFAGTLTEGRIPRPATSNTNIPRKRIAEYLDVRRQEGIKAIGRMKARHTIKDDDAYRVESVSSGYGYCAIYYRNFYGAKGSLILDASQIIDELDAFKRGQIALRKLKAKALRDRANREQRNKELGL